MGRMLLTAHGCDELHKPAVWRVCGGVGQIPRAAHGRDVTCKPAVWRVCGAVGRREPYNLLLESKTYYTQNYDTMR